MSDDSSSCTNFSAACTNIHTFNAAITTEYHSCPTLLQANATNFTMLITTDRISVWGYWTKHYFLITLISYFNQYLNCKLEVQAATCTKLITSFIDLNCTLHLLLLFLPVKQHHMNFKAATLNMKETPDVPTEMDVACHRTLTLSCYDYMLMKDFGQEWELALDWYWIGHRVFSDIVINCKSVKFHNVRGC